MRRTKIQQVDGKPLVELPERQVFVQPVELSLEERKLYDSMAKEGKLVIGKYVFNCTKHCVLPPRQPYSILMRQVFFLQRS